jgi:1-acyl-sn-glycerol-3-phosphate acyltransferase
MRSSAQFLFSRFWFVYFMLSIGFLGSFFAYTCAAPFYLLGRLDPRFTKRADSILHRGILVLFKFQPWFRAQIEIPENPGNLLVVSNHRSHLDVFILLSKIVGLRILSKHSLFYVPFLGVMMWLMRQIPVRPGLENFVNSMETVRSRLKAGEVVHVFPELTRCQPGHRGTLNFSSLPFQIAIQEKLSILPVAIKNTDSTWPKGRNGISFRSKIEARGLAIIDSSQFTSAMQLKNEVQSRIEQALV